MNYKQKYFKHYGLNECDFLGCAVCGAKAVNLHHIRYKSQGGLDDPANLLPLCHNCHDGHHTKNNPTTKELLNLKK